MPSLAFSFIGAVPAFGNEWYPRLMYDKKWGEYKHHIDTYGPQDKFGYKDFIPMFKAEHFDPVAWAELFKKAGAKYVVPVAEHHDGFAMYDSGLSDFDTRRSIFSMEAAKMRPAGSSKATQISFSTICLPPKAASP
jgi:hypothetical protein